MKRIFLLFSAALLLSGCVAEQQDLPTIEPSVTATATTTPETEAPQESLQPALTEELAREIMLASYEEFEVKGMTETVVSDGETWMLVMDPEQPDYQAALFNLDTGYRELVFETDYFTLFVGYLMLESPGSEIEITDEGFIASAADYNPIEYIVKDGLVVGAQGVDFDWSAEFEYSVNPELREGLLELTEELVSSF
jgi:hypothetical protein